MNKALPQTVITLSLPPWLERALPPPDRAFPAVEDRMRFVIGLAQQNIAAGTGGPFAAAVFHGGTGRLITAGVNLVISLNSSIAHAEIIAIMLAQQRAGTYDLGGGGLPPLELVSSTEPCAMCLGALPWSGVRRLVCGATGEDVAGIGFDEGAKPPGWQRELEERGIAVVQNVCRAEAAAVLRRYADQGGIIYNARQGERP
ncbi:MAG: nucleoside deaminase [Nitrospirae bacterium]|nr:nucleoside deaminase [Nitrospirota bacterium]